MTPPPGLVGLLDPGLHRGYAVAGDGAVLAALVRAELAWARTLVDAGRAPADLAERLAGGLRTAPLTTEDAARLVTAGVDGGNPVIPLVEALRSRVGDQQTARFLHRGLTSQDVLDTALMLVAADALDEVAMNLRTGAEALVGLAERHRGTVMVGRTLTQHAVPTTFGLRVAQWSAAVVTSLDEVEACREALPVQCGGAAGTMAGQGVAAATALEGAAPATAIELAMAWARALSLAWPGLPWHTRRGPVTRLGDVLAGVLSVLGHLGTDISTLSRPEIGELSETLTVRQGGSSTMPHKRNPVRSVLLRSAGLQGGPLAGVLHQCSAMAVDDRPDGAWHAEWPVLQRLLILAVGASAVAADLFGGLVVHANVMEARVAGAADDLLSEWRQLTTDLPGAPSVSTEASANDYLGESGGLVDETVRAWRRRATGHGTT